MASYRMSSIQFMTNYKASLNKTYQKQAKILEQGDGTSIHRGSDDPIGYSKLLRYKVSESENDQYTKNVDNAISWMKTSDSVVASMSDRMKTFAEKTVAAANTYNTDADFQSIAKEMFAQIEEIVSEANSQQGDRYLFSGQKDTTQPYVLSHDTYQRGLAKTLDAKQSAFFKGTSGDDPATLNQFLTIEYTDTDTNTTDTYYLDTSTGYVYTKEFVDEGYKELIAQGYTSINDTDAISAASQKLARTYAAGSISVMTLSEAWETVNAATEEELLETIRTLDVNDGEQTTLRSALKVIYDNDYGTVRNNLTNAKSAVAANIETISTDDMKYDYEFRLVRRTYVDYPGAETQYRYEDLTDDTTYNIQQYEGRYSPTEYQDVVDSLLANVYQGSTTTSGGSETRVVYSIYPTTTGPYSTASWSTYDSTTGEISTTPEATVDGTTWNSGISSYRTEILDDIITAIDQYAENSKYTDVANTDDGLDYLPDGTTLDTTAVSDNIARNILDTVQATVPASTDRSDIGVTTDTVGATIDLADTVTSSQLDALGRAEVLRLAVVKAQSYEPEQFKVAHAFTNQGLIHDAVSEDDRNDYVEYKQNSNGTWKVDGIRVAMFTVTGDDHTVTEGDKLNFNFSTVEQRMVNYLGDDNYISMVKMNGANDKSSDVVNLNGNDLYGTDIFDNADSGNDQSGCAMLNNMLTVYTFTEGCDEHWLTSDGVTLSNVSHATLTVAETTLGSRLNLYESVQEMLGNQSTVITDDITKVSGTDVAELATKLMELTTLYNMALSLGGRVLPQSLADYL